jgi:signal transduction histidine kinase
LSARRSRSALTEGDLRGRVTGRRPRIVRTVAERHGGRAWAESVLDQGSTFFLAFPDPR